MSIKVKLLNSNPKFQKLIEVYGEFWDVLEERVNEPSMSIRSLDGKHTRWVLSIEVDKTADYCRPNKVSTFKPKLKRFFDDLDLIYSTLVGISCISAGLIITPINIYLGIYLIVMGIYGVATEIVNNGLIKRFKQRFCIGEYHDVVGR